MDLIMTIISLSLVVMTRTAGEEAETTSAPVASARIAPSGSNIVTNIKSFVPASKVRRMQGWAANKECGKVRRLVTYALATRQQDKEATELME